MACHITGGQQTPSHAQATQSVLPLVGLDPAVDTPNHLGDAQHRVMFLLLFGAPKQCGLQPWNIFWNPRVEQRVAELVSFTSDHPSLPSNSGASVSFSLTRSSAGAFGFTRFLMFSSITARYLPANVMDAISVTPSSSTSPDANLDGPRIGGLIRSHSRGSMRGLETPGIMLWLSGGKVLMQWGVCLQDLSQKRQNALIPTEVLALDRVNEKPS